MEKDLRIYLILARVCKNSDSTGTANGLLTWLDDGKILVNSFNNNIYSVIFLFLKWEKFHRSELNI